MGLQWLLCGQSPIGFLFTNQLFLMRWGFNRAFLVCSVAAVASKQKKSSSFRPHLSPGRSRKSLNFKSGSLRSFGPKERTLTWNDWVFLCGGYLDGSPKTGSIQGTKSRFYWCVLPFQQSFLCITCIGDEKNKTHVFEFVHPRWSASLAGAGSLLLCRYLHRTSFLWKDSKGSCLYIFVWLVFYTD